MAKKRLTKKQRARRILKLRILVLASLAAIAALVVLIVKSAGYDLINENDPVATIRLKNGDKVIVELYPDKAPGTVANFISLANAGFYDGQALSLSEDASYLQSGGDAGYDIRGEFALNGFENDVKHERGVLSMARLTLYDSASGSFFLCLKDMPYIDGAYAAFGRVVKGLDSLDKGQPVIESIRVDAKAFAGSFEKLAREP